MSTLRLRATAASRCPLRVPPCAPPVKCAAGIVALAGIILILSSPAAHAQAIAHWALDETSPGPAVDGVGGFDGVNNGATIGVPGQFGTAYDFNGMSNYVNIGNLPAFDFDYNTPFSVSAWVRRDGTGTRAILAKVNPNSPFDGWVIAQRDVAGNAALDFSLGASTTNRLLVDSVIAIPAGSLSHVAVSYDGSGSAAGAKMFIDGLPVGSLVSVNNPVGTAVNAQPVTIGSYAGVNRFFDGLIDDVGVFNQALSFAQVRSIYENGVAAFNAGATVSGNVLVASYDGSYAPDSPAPPPGQTTWSVFDNIAGSSILPNTPTAGIANINDNSTTGRLSFFDTLTDSMLVDVPWTMESRMRINSMSLPANTFIAIGVRDEGGTDGKNAMLGFNPDGSLFLGNAAIAVSSDNFVDNQFHTYRVEKYEEDGQFLVQVFVNDAPQFAVPLAYSDLPNQLGTGDGIGFFSSTPGLSNVDLDFLTLNIPLPAVAAVVPEPASIVLWSLLGGAVLACCCRRRRK